VGTAVGAGEEFFVPPPQAAISSDELKAKAKLNTRTAE
jgi:hypothetical protein